MSVTDRGGSAALPGAGEARLIDPQPLEGSGRNWARWAGPAFSIAVLGMVAWMMRDLDWRTMLAMTPRQPLFWIALALYYLTGPASELVIFRKLWNLPSSAFPALLRKQVSNELLLGYLGEVYFYAWAKRHARLDAAPFGAIKDVAILSAIMGNVFTLLMVILAAPFINQLNLPMRPSSFVGSVAFVLISSLLIGLLRNRLFSLPRGELWFVAGIHAVRIVVMMVLASVMWHLILPAVPIEWWLLLATLRQLISRLPFIPNKDVVFAGLAAFLVGPGSAIGDAMALQASLIVLAHMFVGSTLGLTGLLEERTAR